VAFATKNSIPQPVPSAGRDLPGSWNWGLQVTQEEIRLKESQTELAFHGIVRPYELLQDSSTGCLVMEDRDGMPLAAMHLNFLEFFFKVAT